MPEANACFERAFFETCRRSTKKEAALAAEGVVVIEACIPSGAKAPNFLSSSSGADKSAPFQSKETPRPTKETINSNARNIGSGELTTAVDLQGR
jgi:hypothetical protein